MRHSQPQQGAAQSNACDAPRAGRRCRRGPRGPSCACSPRWSRGPTGCARRRSSAAARPTKTQVMHLQRMAWTALLQAPRRHGAPRGTTTLPAHSPFTSRSRSYRLQPVQAHAGLVQPLPLSLRPSPRSRALPHLQVEDHDGLDAAWQLDRLPARRVALRPRPQHLQLHLDSQRLRVAEPACAQTRGTAASSG